MPLDPQIAPLIDVINTAALDAPPLDQQTPEMRREAYHKLLEPIPAGPDLASVDDVVADGPGGGVPLRVYRPSLETTAGIIVYYHGGGWCIGDLDSHDEVCRQLAAQSGGSVVSVGYRLAPEHSFPAAVDDAWTALRWVMTRRQEFAGSPRAEVVVAGDSAGGNLAAVVALMGRDETEIDIAAQLLVYPAVDARMCQFESLVENGEGYILTKEGMDWFVANYLADPSQSDDWRASPLLASSHAGLPPTLVITAEFDPLRDEGAAYAETLRAAGVDVTHTNYDGMAHIFFQLGPIVDAGARAVSQVATAAADVFGAR